MMGDILLGFDEFAWSGFTAAVGLYCLYLYPSSTEGVGYTAVICKGLFWCSRTSLLLLGGNCLPCQAFISYTFYSGDHCGMRQYILSQV